MRYEVTRYPNGNVDVTLYGATVLECETGWERDAANFVKLGMAEADFESLRSREAIAGIRRQFADAKKEAERLSDERDEAAAQAELWRKLAERQDNTAPLRTELRVAERERDELQRRVDYLKYQVESLSAVATEDDVDELKAVIVSQAREIARLKGESE